MGLTVQAGRTLLPVLACQIFRSSRLERIPASRPRPAALPTRHTSNRIDATIDVIQFAAYDVWFSASGKLPADSNFHSKQFSFHGFANFCSVTRERLRRPAPALNASRSRRDSRQEDVQMQAIAQRKFAHSRYRSRMPLETPDSTGALETALELRRKSLRLVPLAGKRAIVKDWPSLNLGESDVRAWAEHGVNWGVITGEPLIVLDTDTAAAEAWVNQRNIDSPVVVRSGGGGLHRYFRAPEQTEVRSRSAVYRISGLDVKGWHGYIVAAGSVHPETRRPYEYLPGRVLGNLHELPVFDPAWVREIRAEPSRKPESPAHPRGVNGLIHDVRAYVRVIPSVEGSGGDRACFRVACLLAEAGFTFEEALVEILDWNQTNAFPPWEAKELQRKLRYAFARVIGTDASLSRG